MSRVSNNQFGVIICKHFSHIEEVFETRRFVPGCIASNIFGVVDNLLGWFRAILDFFGLDQILRTQKDGPKGGTDPDSQH